MSQEYKEVLIVKCEYTLNFVIYIL